MNVVVKKAFFILVYSLVLIVIGRQISIIPLFSFQSKESRLEGKKEELKKLLSEENGSFSIHYENLSTGYTIQSNAEKILTGASLNKIYIVGFLYRLASQGKFDLESKITIQERDIQDYGTGSLRYEGKGKTYSYKTLAELALRESDNTAAHVIALKVGRDNVQRYIDSLGLKSTNIEKNTTSAQDTGFFFKLLYQGGVAGYALDRELLGYMTDTLFEDRIALFLKDKATIHHKTGDATNMVHDAGIVEGGTDPFVVVVMTSDITDEKRTKVIIGKIAHLFY